MRIDKFLKVSRILKRRSLSKEACDGGRVTVNGKAAEFTYDGFFAEVKVDFNINETLNIVVE